MYSVTVIPELLEKIFAYQARGHGAVGEDLKEGKITPDEVKEMLDYARAWIWTVMNHPELWKCIVDKDEHVQ